ncbi:MAG: hypothetical protein HY678_06100 [Chloroflexi bacterium]|nr:hypothetical protein [Chloroflexota bacterium]
MELYWRRVRRGLDLVVKTDSGEEVSVGGVRETKRGIEAIAKTMGYDPGRASKDLTTVEDAMQFVENFEPWLDFFGVRMEVDREIRPTQETGAN